MTMLPTGLWYVLRESYVLAPGIEREAAEAESARSARGRRILELLAAEGKYPCVEVCVKRAASAARRVYERAGFVDTGYIDPDLPDSLNLRYTFGKER